MFYWTNCNVGKDIDKLLVIIVYFLRYLVREVNTAEPSSRWNMLQVQMFMSIGKNFLLVEN